VIELVGGWWVGEGRVGWELLWNGPDQLQLPVISRFFSCRREGGPSQELLGCQFIVSTTSCARPVWPYDARYGCFDRANGKMAVCLPLDNYKTKVGFLYFVVHQHVLRQHASGRLMDVVQ
jgi:hypothetical protein